MMLSKQICSLAAATLVAFSYAQSTPSKECATGVHIISGHAHEAGPLGPQISPLVPIPVGAAPIVKRADKKKPSEGPQLYGVFEGIREAIPGTTNYTVSAISKSVVFVEPEVNHNTKVFTKAIEEYVTSCPDTPVVITGYSVGAVEGSNVLCGSQPPSGTDQTPPLPQRYGKNVLAAIFFGDESHQANEPFNAGTCKTFGPGVRANRTACYGYKSKIKNWCDAEDMLCCIGGTQRSAHFAYKDKYTDDAVKFVVKKWTAHKRSLRRRG